MCFLKHQVFQCCIRNSRGQYFSAFKPMYFFSKASLTLHFPLIQVTLKSPTQISSALNFFWLHACQAQLPTLFELASTGLAPGNLVTTWLLFSAPSAIQILPDFYLPLLWEPLACNRSPHTANLHLPINIMTQKQFKFKIKILTCTAPQVCPTFYRLKEHSYHEFKVETHQNSIQCNAE